MAADKVAQLHLRIGDAVEVDARGRLHEQRAEQEKPGGMEL
ncbi:MAG TPA: hypothetical protein PLD10_05250 [Rhodopila sp.]|nr:hypothetical protein [Rhodopila sp.]